MDFSALTEEERAALRRPANQPGSQQVATDQPGSRTPADLPHPSLIELHRAFAKSLSATLTGLAGREFEVNLREQGLATYARFVLSQPHPACCAVTRSDATDLEFYLSVQPAIMYPLLDRMLGSKQSDPIPQRPLTEIESGLAWIVFQELVAEYGNAWQRALSLELRVDRIATDVRQLGVLPGSSPTYHAHYEVRSRHDFGHLEICLPWSATRRLRQRLANN